MIECFLISHGAAIVFAALWAISEALSYIPWLKEKGVFQVVRSFLRALVSKVKKKR
jgi:hypothetical protein